MSDQEPEPHAGGRNAPVARPGMRLPMVGHLPLPSATDSIYLGGLALLAALELIDWPVAVAIALGHEIVSRARDTRAAA